MTCIKACLVPPPNAEGVTARFLAPTCSLFFVLTMAAVEINLPQTRHGLHFTNAVRVWDEALPLGNGILGALVWGDGQPLKISLDRTDLWDLTPVPEFQSADR